MDTFVQTKSITNRLTWTITLISTFFVLEVVGIYFSSRDFLDGIGELHSIIKTTEVTRKAKQLTPVVRDSLTRFSTNNTDEKEFALYRSTELQAKQLLERGLLLANADPQITSLLQNSQETLTQIGLVAETLKEKKLNPTEAKGQLLVLEQFILEFIEPLNKAEISLTAKSNLIFDHLYAIRFRPILFSVGLGILFLAFALWSGFNLSRRFKRSINGLLDAMKLITSGNLSLRAVIREPDEIGKLTHTFNMMTASLQESTVSKHHLEMANEALASANKELESFSYSVSHDLRAPLRAVDGFSQALIEDYSDKLDDEAKRYLNRIRLATQKMGNLIDDILKLSRISRAGMNVQLVDLSEIAQSVVEEIKPTLPKDRDVTFKIQPHLIAHADSVLMRIVLSNLIGNAVKYTSKHLHAEIEIGANDSNGPQLSKTFYIRDDGAGFDMAYTDKLFGAFQRLHRDSEFPGTGIGLATVQRIIHRHQGQIWAKSAVEKGATFFFTINS